MSSSEPLLPETRDDSPSPVGMSRGRMLLPSRVISALLWFPVRVTLGGITVIGAGALGERNGFSRRSTTGVAVAALGATQAIIYGCGALRRRRRRLRDAEIERATKVRHLMDWNEALGALRTIVDTFSHGLAQPFTLKHLLLDAELLRRHHTVLYKEDVGKKHPPSDEAPLIEGRHFAKFAMASYGYTLLKLLGLIDETHDLFRDGANAIEVVMHQCSLSASDILMANLSGDELGLPRHFVARDPESKSIVVAVRGTNSVSDVLLDLLCDSAPFGKGYAHSGMKDAAEALYSATVPTIRKALQENKGYTVVTAGHSLGAGVAILLTKILLDNGFRNTRCFALAPCPVFGPMYCVDERWKNALECFVHADDIVPRLSLMSARALVMEIERIDGLPLSDNDLRGLNSTSLRAAIAGRRSQSQVERDKREIAVAPLYIPTAKVHWLLPSDDDDDAKGDEVYQSVRASTMTFSRMLITRGCVTSHFPNRYVEALDRLGLPSAPERPRRAPQSRTATHGPYYDGELGM